MYSSVPSFSRVGLPSGPPISCSCRTRISSRSRSRAACLGRAAVLGHVLPQVETGGPLHALVLLLRRQPGRLRALARDDGGALFLKFIHVAEFALPGFLRVISGDAWVVFADHPGLIILQPGFPIARLLDSLVKAGEFRRGQFLLLRQPLQPQLDGLPPLVAGAAGELRAQRLALDAAPEVRLLHLRGALGGGPGVFVLGRVDLAKLVNVALRLLLLDEECLLLILGEMEFARPPVVRAGLPLDFQRLPEPPGALLPALFIVQPGHLGRRVSEEVRAGSFGGQRGSLNAPGEFLNFGLRLRAMLRQRRLAFRVGDGVVDALGDAAENRNPGVGSLDCRTTGEPPLHHLCGLAARVRGGFRWPGFNRAGDPLRHFVSDVDLCAQEGCFERAGRDEESLNGSRRISLLNLGGLLPGGFLDLGAHLGVVLVDGQLARLPFLHVAQLAFACAVGAVEDSALDGRQISGALLAGGDLVTPVHFVLLGLLRAGGLGLDILVPGNERADLMDLAFLRDDFGRGAQAGALHAQCAELLLRDLLVSYEPVMLRLVLRGERVVVVRHLPRFAGAGVVADIEGALLEGFEVGGHLPGGLADDAGGFVSADERNRQLFVSHRLLSASWPSRTLRSRRGSPRPGRNRPPPGRAQPGRVCLHEPGARPCL